MAKYKKAVKAASANAGISVNNPQVQGRGPIPQVQNNFGMLPTPRAIGLSVDQNTPAGYSPD
jgi:hypothetical protein